MTVNLSGTYRDISRLWSDGELTLMEAKTLNTIMLHLSEWEPDSEPGFSDLEAEDVAQMIGEDMKSVRGYLGSLVKKGYIEIEDDVINFDRIILIYLTDKSRQLY